MAESLPSRGAWIEIYFALSLSIWALSRSPHGERGLKSMLMHIDKTLDASLPSRGAWIEINWSCRLCWSCMTVAPLTGSVD